MMANVPHVTSGLGLRKFQADRFLLTRVYIICYILGFSCYFEVLLLVHALGFVDIL